MATYAIGDIQGCYSTLQRLLARIRFDADVDRLWLVGDLVNRGPRSLEVLRLLRAHAHCVVAVLGNHDLHLLARAAGVGRPKRRDTLDAVLAAHDRTELLDWLRSCPLLYREGAYLIVHAGLWPGWTLAMATRAARTAEAALRGGASAAVLAGLYEPGPLRYEPRAARLNRVQATLRIFTRMRMLRPDGTLLVDYTGPPALAPAGARPWFVARGPRRGPTIICGHWAALGLVRAPKLLALDTGCVWGGALTAVRLEDGACVAQPCAAGERGPR